MNSATATAIRKFKTADGAYVWQPGMVSGAPPTLLGYPVIEAEDMPDVAASSLSIAFGNFKAGYTIAERNATTILRDPFTNKPYVHFYATQRIDLLLCPAIEGAALTTPPASPAAGACYLVGTGATGAWAGKDGMVAGFTEGGWRFIAPIEGMRMLDRTSGQLVVRRAGAWEAGISRASEYQVAGVTVVRERQAAIADPAGGATVDDQARTTVIAILAMLRTHGLIA